MAKNEKDIIQFYNECYDEAYSAWSPFYPKAEEDLRFYLGDQWDANEKKRLREEGRNAFVFNRIRRNISMIDGYQRKNRLSSVVSPIENSDQKTADQFSQLLLYAMQAGYGYQTISDAFSGANKTGWNLVSIYLDFSDDPLDGDIKFCREPYSAFIVDPKFSKLDFSDCAYIIKRKYLLPDQVVALLPGKEKEINKIAENGSAKDDKFTWMLPQQSPIADNLMAYTEFYLQKYKNVPMLVDMETGEYSDWDGDKARLEMLKTVYPNLEVVKRPKRYIERHVIVNDTIMLTDINPYGLDEYPCVPFVAVFEPESDDWELKIQSLVRCQIDPQREANRRRSQMTDILDSQINSGWIADEDSVINPRSLFQTSQGKVIWRKQDAKPGALEKVPPAQIPPSMFQLQELYDRDMVDILGLNDASFGTVENANDSGIMMMLRQSSAIMNLQYVFDNLRFAQKCLSKKVVKLIQSWSPSKIERILNEKPTEQFYTKDFTKYDVTISEGILTDSQRMMYFRQLIDLKQLTDVPGQGPITAQMLIDAAPIQGKSILNEQIAQNEQASQQAAAQQQQVQQQLLDSQRQQAQAKAIADLALSKERFTRAVANMGLEDSRSSDAVSKRSDAALARIKAIKEIQDMDDTRIMRYLGLIRLMEESSQRQEEEIKADNVQVSALSSRDMEQQVQDQAMQDIMRQQALSGQQPQMQENNPGPMQQGL